MSNYYIDGKKPPVIEYRCPYCGSELTAADITRDNEALHCADCGERVGFVDATEEGGNGH